MDHKAVFVQAMRYWYDASGRSKLKLGTFSGALDYYRRVSPKFESNFGDAAASIPQKKVKAAMTKLGESFGIQFPPYNEFFNYLSVSAGSWNWDDTKAVAEKTVKDVQKTALLGLGIWAVFAGGAIALFVFRSLNAKVRK